MTLRPADFAEFFHAVHGRGPFLWQQRLVDQIAADGIWPDLVDLPTGTGKTSVIDVALFVQALRGDQPRRVVFVVDRRIVVHQAAVHATRLCDALTASPAGAVAMVAAALRGLAYKGDPATPLQIAELRGGIERDDDWVRRPDVPAVVVSTVDQVGSRLLFRGYGVSHGMRPVHAGLLGNDVLFVLDEVHLARPFADTLTALRDRYRPAAGLPDRWAVVTLSATSPRRPASTFTLIPEDRESPDLRRRLSAHKPAETRLVPVRGRDRAAHRVTLARAAVAAASDLMSREGIRTVGVVVNRVDTAVRVYRAWPGQEKVLLTGRMRPLDRDRRLERYKDRLRTGRPRPDECPLLVVATQALEAGEDVDLDALVTECAPLDALIQRFGRVDRDGRLTEAGLHTASVVLVGGAQLKEPDPVYGDALRATWAWMTREPVDFGPDHLRAPDPNLLSPSDDAPVLLPGHLDRWVQTSHVPDADPEPELWLHGLRELTPEVGLVWRADLPADLLTDRPDDLVRLRALIEACPPQVGEVLPVPLAAVHRWLGGAAPASVSDALVDPGDPGDPDGPDGPDGPDTTGDIWRPALVFDGDNTRVAVRPSQVKPHAVLIVPAGYGGLTGGTWDPTATERVEDLGTAAALPRDPALRLSPELLGNDVPRPDPDDPLSPAETRRMLASWLTTATAKPELDAGADDAIIALRAPGVRLRPVAVDLSPSDQRYVLRVDRRQRADSEPATSSFLGAATSLGRHLDDVERWADELGKACKLPAPLRADLALAAAVHDLGKADPRCQRMLRAGSPLRDGLLAKSGLAAADYRGRQRAALASGYPAYTRHELTSVALVEHEPWLREQANDLDLVLHLVASHHGYGRPFLPVPATAPPVTVEVTHRGHALATSSDHGLVSPAGGVPDRFWRCVRRYGWHGLAWLEAILRLADHRASEEAEQSP